ncbi:hypothetical protein [Taibaiella soli]|uniref:Outer membrane protein beta-barrel domain-containing protein n=1 Tax=Taibaiella soli TaxID=1649169 RepID=A0A2W2C2R4_9BACT|nr:hypothetical protein [Taibaiella soli]PZF74393.1 hypothetical protein DN068_02095 [Taibaiella soli]
MNTSEFDNLLRDQFDDGEFEYKPAQWERMVIDLNAAGNVHKKKSRVLPAVGMAAALAVALITSGLWLLRKPATHLAFSKRQSNQQINPVGNDNGNNAGGNSNVSAALAANTAPTVHFGPPVPIRCVQYVRNKPASVAADTTTPLIAANTPTEKQTEEQQKKNYDKVDLSMPAGDYPDEVKRTKKLSVGITGGVNYGSASSGYMAGVNAHQPLGRKFFVDGDLAVISSKNLQNTANYSSTDYNTLSSYGGTDHTGTNTGTGAGQPLGNMKPPPKGQTITNLYYLQFAPTIGYQLIRKVSVGVGADVQRKLQDDDMKTVVSDNPQVDDIKLIPNMDVGLTGKAEYNITKKLKAGVLYRGGINSWIDPKYVNRNYMQVQMKFMIFGK